MFHTETDNEKLELAIWTGDIEEVQRLLREGNLDLMASNNKLLRFAFEKGRTEEAALLIADPRISPLAIKDMMSEPDLQEGFKDGAVREAIAVRVKNDPEWGSEGSKETPEDLMQNQQAEQSNQVVAEQGMNYSTYSSWQPQLQQAQEQAQEDVQSAPSTPTEQPKLTEDNPDLIFAAMDGRERDVKKLLEEKIGYTDTTISIAFRWAVQRSHVKLVKLFLDDGRVDPTANDNEALRFALEKGNSTVAALLIADPRISLSAIRDMVVEPDLVNTLMKEKVREAISVRVDNDPEWGFEESEEGQEDVIQSQQEEQSSQVVEEQEKEEIQQEWNINRGRRDMEFWPQPQSQPVQEDIQEAPSIPAEQFNLTNDDMELMYAAMHGSLEKVKRFLEDKIGDPDALNSDALRHAAQSGRLEIVKLLLADGRADPAAGDCKALRAAIENGHTKVAVLLVSDPRISLAAIRSLEADPVLQKGLQKIKVQAAILVNKSTSLFNENISKKQAIAAEKARILAEKRAAIRKDSDKSYVRKRGPGGGK